MSEWKHNLGDMVIEIGLTGPSLRSAEHGLCYGGRIIERHLIECPAGVQRFYQVEMQGKRMLIQEGGLRDYQDYLTEVFAFRVAELEKSSAKPRQAT